MRYIRADAEFISFLRFRLNSENIVGFKGKFMEFCEWNISDPPDINDTVAENINENNRKELNKNSRLRESDEDDDITFEDAKKVNPNQTNNMKTTLICRENPPFHY